MALPSRAQPQVLSAVAGWLSPPRGWEGRAPTHLAPAWTPPLHALTARARLAAQGPQRGRLSHSACVPGFPPGFTEYCPLRLEFAPDFNALQTVLSSLPFLTNHTNVLGPYVVFFWYFFSFFFSISFLVQVKLG